MLFVSYRVKYRTIHDEIYLLLQSIKIQTKPYLAVQAAVVSNLKSKTETYPSSVQIKRRIIFSNALQFQTRPDFSALIY